jgi:hypothetical protein
MGYVYLIRNGDLHKIGRTDNLARRMKQLQPDEVLEVLETDRSRDLEHELHEQFKSKRVPQTEYFRLNEAEVNLVRMNLGWDPDGPVTLPPLHELAPSVAEARTSTRITGIATAVSLAALGVEGLIIGPDSSLLEGLLGLATGLGFAVSSVALLGAVTTYGVRWGWHKLRQRQG